MSHLGETYESLNIEPKPLRPHILAAATVVFGDDYYNGIRETISLSGFVQLNKWPMPGFNHRVDEKGHAEFDLELISAPEVGIKGYSYVLNDRIQVLSNPELPNAGHVRQIVPGQNFPAYFHIRRFGILETSTMRLVHRDVISINGIVDSIPPYKQPATPPLLGRVQSDGPGNVVPGPNVVRGTNLPEAWYPADENNRSVGITPTVFFADSMGPCISMLVDPSLIIQSTTEAKLTLEVGGKTVKVDVFGDRRLAAGSELLLFEPEKSKGEGILAQMARVAMVGECPALGGRIMIRTSFFNVSSGTLGEGDERTLEAVKYPGELDFDAQVEIVTPEGVLYAKTPIHLSGRLEDLDATNSSLRMEGADAALATEDGVVRSRITGLEMKLRDAVTGREASVNDEDWRPAKSTGARPTIVEARP